jgi:hypothetical protein
MDLQEQIDKYCATKVELMGFREEVAIQFGKVHVEIAKLETSIAAMEIRLIKWLIAIVISNATISLAIARYFS